MPTPLILAFDTSAAHCAAAVVHGNEELASDCVPMRRGQAEALMPLIDSVLKKASVGLTDLDAIGVGTGPGNFTGTRISVALARGLSLGTGLPAIGVSLLEAYGLDVSGLVCVPARRGFVYVLGSSGTDPAEPELLDLNNATERFGKTSGRICLGPGAIELAPLIGGIAVDPTASPALVIARTALAKFADGPPFGRPTPLYLRPADAAPARDAPPRMLP